MSKRTEFLTVPSESIRELLKQAEILEAEEAAANAVAICLACGHPASDHSFENRTCWHSTIQNGNVTICNCRGWLAQA